MDLSGLDSSLPAGLADAERDMTDKFRGKLSRGVKLTTAAALSITNLYKTSLGNTKVRDPLSLDNARRVVLVGFFRHLAGGGRRGGVLQRTVWWQMC